jgi:uncharacterized protein
MPTVVACPTCGAAVTWSPESRFRPFCSERCKQIDLGAWAEERYRIGSGHGEAEGDEVPPDVTGGELDH